MLKIGGGGNEVFDIVAMYAKLAEPVEEANS
jgi:hypothetical protein